MTKSYDQKKGLLSRIRRFEDHLQGREGQILLAAFNCIYERGIAATSTRTIAQRAGLNQGLIHYYFQSKDDVLLSLLRLIYLNSTSNIEAIGASSLPPFEKLEWIIRAGISLIGPRRQEFVVFIAFWAHAMSVGGEMLALFRKLLVKFRKAITKIVREGEGLSVFNPSKSEEAALLVVALIQGLGLQYTIEPKDFDQEKVLHLFTTLILEPLRIRNKYTS